jgi:general stress protein CsbA
VFYLFQAATAAILILAANTAFNGFPGLASILARDSYLPRQLHNRGDRLVFSNGVVLLAGAAAALVIGFDANIDRLIQLYIVGVFTSFTLSQVGMVRHWQRLLRGQRESAGVAAAPNATSSARTMRRAQAINGVGALFTAVVLVVVFATKVTHGAWIAVAAMIALFIAMRAINRYYTRVTVEVAADDDELRTLPSRVHALVLVSRLHKPAMQALALARGMRPDVISAVTLAVDLDETRKLRTEWESRAIPVPLTMLEAPFRDPIRPLLDYVKELRRVNPRTVIMVFIPEYVVTHWWQQLLHNQSALRFKARLLFTPGVVVVSVPYHLGVGEAVPAPAQPVVGGSMNSATATAEQARSSTSRPSKPRDPSISSEGQAAHVPASSAR